MKQYNEQMEMIEDYLGNHMTPEEKQEVERMANEDSELARQIAEQRLLIAALQEQGRRQNEDFANKMKAIPREEMEKFIASKRRKNAQQHAEKTEKKEEKKRSVFFSGWAKSALLAAAVFLGVFLCFNIFYHSGGPSYTSEQIAQINDCKNNIYGMPTMRGGTADNDRLAKAIELVQDNDEAKHKQGIDELKTLFNETKDPHTGECLAIALIADGELDEAKDILPLIKDAEFYPELERLIHDLK